MATAMEMIMTGDPMPAQRAYELGMINMVAEKDQVMAEAEKLAERISANAPLAVQASRRVAARAFMDDDDTLWKNSGKEFVGIAGTEDFREGPLAFIEKRAPNWKGK
jgi:enoyl-CoA hydratase